MGGQSGQSWLGENNIWIAALVAAVVVLLGFGPRACDGEATAPMDGGDHQCEEAWVDANDGVEEAEADPIHKEPWCEQHNAAMRQVQEMKQQQEVTEQFQEATP